MQVAARVYKKTTSLYESGRWAGEQSESKFLDLQILNLFVEHMMTKVAALLCTVATFYKITVFSDLFTSCMSDKSLRTTCRQLPTPCTYEVSKDFTV